MRSSAAAAPGVRPMTDPPRIRPLLKRGALVTAANWPVVAVQFVADTSFKLLLMVPIAGGALLVGAAAGGDLRQLTDGDVRAVVAATMDALGATPAALGAFLAAFALVLIGRSGWPPSSAPTGSPSIAS